jgi:uncharacterized protein (DUF1015 family)
MAKIRPFRALRPEPSLASRIAAVPYDVVNTEEARALAAGNELSFLHVSRAEIDLPPDTNPYADIVYRTAADRFARMREHLIEESEPALYFYKLRMGAHEQTGLAACYSLDEYDAGLVRSTKRRAATRKTTGRGTSRNCARRRAPCSSPTRRRRRRTRSPRRWRRLRRFTTSARRTASRTLSGR